MSGGVSATGGTPDGPVKDPPRFSIVICNFNYARFVGQAIRSALNQDYPADRLQVIVVDDGSTDDSRRVYSGFAADTRFAAVLQENRGQTAAFTAGVKVATGDYICLLDVDDVYLPHKLQRVARHIDALSEPPEALFLCHDLAVEDSSGPQPVRSDRTWFDMVEITRLPDCMTLAHEVEHFPFSIPCGLVFSRALIAACLDALPSWDFPRGTDGILCPAALLKTGRVHYLREQLGIYRIHGGNEFASLVDGAYIPRFNPHGRAPKSLRFLEHWVDMLDQPAAERATAIDYLRRVEHRGRRLSASRQLGEPLVSVAMLAAGPATAGASEVATGLQSHARTEFLALAQEGRSELEVMAQAYATTTGDYLVFLRAGDRMDRLFVERHLHWRQHGALVAVSCSDIRLASAEGHLVHADVMRNSGAWKQPLQQIPPLATTLRDWVAPPMSACLFRRGAFLDALFSQTATVPESLRHNGFWLAFQLQHHTGGVLRLLETLTTCRLPDGAAASYGYLSAPSGLDARLQQPPVAEAATWLADFYGREQDLFRQWLPAAWHRRFEPWLAAHTNPPARA